MGVLALLPCAPVLAGPPTDRLREFFASVDAVLADSSVEPLDKVARTKRLVTNLADVRGAAIAALGPAWEARTAAEQSEFTGLFAELLERAYVGRLAGTVSASSGMAMTWAGETLAGDEATVKTVVRARDGRDVVVEYRMALRRGRWLVRDVVLEGVSTVENYRAQFKRLLGLGPYAKVLTALRAKLAEDTLMFARSDRAPAVLTLAMPEEPPVPGAPSAPAVMPSAAPRATVQPRAVPPAPARVVAAPRVVAPMVLPRARAELVQPPPAARVAPAVPRPPVLRAVNVEIPAPEALLPDGDGGVLAPAAAPSSAPRVEAGALDVSGVDASTVGLRALVLTFVAALAAALLRRGAPAR